eukprot:COSAG04_NODE_1938_length_5175_cov_178.678093_6_plen_94_part_00
MGWLFGCRRCAAVDELRAGCDQRYATKRCLQLHYLANASSTGPGSGTLRCGLRGGFGARSSRDQAVSSMQLQGRSSIGDSRVVEKAARLVWCS